MFNTTQESVDANTLKRRRPEWRSQELNEFLDELDQRSYQSSKHPRKVRLQGSPLKGPGPLKASEWMKRQDEYDLDAEED